MPADAAEAGKREALSYGVCGARLGASALCILHHLRLQTRGDRNGAAAPIVKLSRLALKDSWGKTGLLSPVSGFEDGFRDGAWALGKYDLEFTYIYIYINK